MSRSIIMCCVMCAFATFVADSRVPLYIGSLHELTNIPYWYRKTLTGPKVADMTIEKINNASILKEYELRITRKDVEWSSGLAAKRLMELMTEEPPKVAIFGPGFSNNLAVTAQIAPYFNVIEVAYYDTASSLADQSLYRTLYTVNYILDVLNPVLMRMMDHFGWTRIGTVGNQDPMFTDTLAQLHKLFDEHNKTLVTTAVSTDPVDNAMEIIQRLQRNDVRIVLMVVTGATALKLFCQAYKARMFGSGYVWLALGPVLQYHRSPFDESMGCTEDEFKEASTGSFMLNYYVLSSTDTVTSFGERPSEIITEIESRFDVNLKEMSLYWSGGFCMAIDALWAIAYGLNNSLKYLEEKGLKLHEYNYSTDYLDAVMRGMNEVHFDGVSGPVSFGKNGQRKGLSYIQQISDMLDNTWTDIAVYEPDTDTLTWLESDDKIWKGGHAPMDRFKHVRRLVEPNIVAFWTMILLDTLGAVLTFAFLVFNVYYRNQRSVRLSSPMLNNVILAGCVLMYLVVVVECLDYIHVGNQETIDMFCMLKAWLFSLGFTTLFGALFSKTYRVYVIFRNYKIQRKHIMDAHLLMIIMGLIIVDVIILTVWSLSHHMIKINHFLGKEIVVENNAIITEISQFCYNKNQAYYFAALYIYKGLLLAFGTFLAWETRQVSVPELNDSKQIGACIYNVVVVCIFGVPIGHVLPVGQTTLAFVLESCLIIFCTTICQCIIFLPKLKFINQVNPRFVTAQLSGHSKKQTTGCNSKEVPSGSTSRNCDLKTILPEETPDNCKKLDAVMEENKRLRMQIAQESIAIAKLRHGLQQMTGNIHFYRSGSQYVLFKSDSANS